MANPFCESRKNKLTDAASELLKTFSVEYSISYGSTLLQDVQQKLQGQPDDSRRLKYREWTKVGRDNLFHGPCYMKSGDGPGAYHKWKHVYIAERPDYDIDIYGSEKDYEAKKKPHSTINVVGYTLERDPSWHYSCEMATLAHGLGLSGAEVELLTFYSQYAWALTHRWRKNYIFQLHRTREPLCMCLGGSAIESSESEEVGKEEAESRDRYVTVFENCTQHATARDIVDLKVKAFDKTVCRMKNVCSRLEFFEDDGTETEILKDMLLEQCFVPMRDDMLTELQGPISVRVSMWYNIKSVVQLTIHKLVDPAWKTMQTGIDELHSKIDPIVNDGADQIFKLKENTKQKIREKISNPAGKLLQTNVTPYLKPVMNELEDPLQKAFQRQKNIYTTQVPDIQTLSNDEAERNSQLDAIPRQYDIVNDMCVITYDLVEPLKQLRRISDTLFTDLDPYKYRINCENVLLQTLDAAIYTLEQKITSDGKSNELKLSVLEDFNHDAILARGQFIKDILRDLLVGGFRRALNPITQPLLTEVDGTLPDDMKQIISVTALYDDIVELLIAEPIDQMVNGAYSVESASGSFKNGNGKNTVSTTLQ